MPRIIEQTPEINPRLQVNEGEDGGFLSTALKVGAVIAGLAASIGSFIVAGPVAGLVVTLASSVGLLFLFRSCSGAHNHYRAPNDIQEVHIPWYQRVFYSVPAMGSGYRQPSGPHVPVGQGHAPRPWYDVFSYLPSGVRDSHVPVGRGHGAPGHPHGNGPTQTPPPSGPGGHVPVGRGHAGRGGGHGPTQTPPPSGPGGHVPVGRGHRN